MAYRQHAQNDVPGFTLLEFLLVMGITSLLSGIVLTTLNPGDLLRTSRDAERRHNARELQHAQYQYLLDAGHFAADGVIPEGSQNAKQICRFGRADATCINADALVPSYLACIPYDGAEANLLHTGYRMYLASGRIDVVSSYLGIGPAIAGGCEGGAIASVSSSSSSMSSSAMSSSSAVSSSSSSSAPGELVAYWKFDETTLAEVATDASGFGHHGTPVNVGSPHGPTTNVPSAITFPNVRARSFDGNNDHVSVSATPALDVDQTFTISAWFSYNVPKISHTILSRLDGSGHLELAILIVSNRITVYLHNTPYTFTPSPKQQWIHLAVVRDGPRMTVFTNGTNGVRFIVGDTTLNYGGCGRFFIGARASGGCMGGVGHFLGGRLDDVRIYRTALTTAQIATLAAGNP